MEASHSLLQSSSVMCSPLWNNEEARFTSCGVNLLYLISAISSIAVLTVYAARRLLPLRPLWLRNFVPETPVEELRYKGACRSYTNFTIALILLSLVNFVTETIAGTLDGKNAASMFLIVPWATLLLMFIVQPPRRAPLLGCFLVTITFLVKVIALSHLSREQHAGKLRTLNQFQVVLMAIEILTILLMPMYDPETIDDGVSEPLSEPQPDLRSPEDKLKLWHFLTIAWMEPLISIGRKKQLNDQDVWLLSYQFQHRRLHEAFKRLQGTVFSRLMRANGLDVILACVLEITELLCDFAAPVLLQQLLLSMEEPTIPKTTTLVYALLSLGARLVSAQAETVKLWFQRRSYERSRGELITMIFEKATRRKNMGMQYIPEPDITEVQNGTHQKDRKHVGLVSKAVGLVSNVFRQCQQCCGRPSQPHKGPKPKLAASEGKVLNLIRGDAYGVSQRFWEASNLVRIPFGLITSVVLIWTIVGWPCLLGAVTVITAQIINVYVGKQIAKWEGKNKAATDVKLQITNQFVHAIRHLRWYGWQGKWLDRILQSRQQELNVRVVFSLWKLLMQFLNDISNSMFPVVAFYAYTVMAGRELRVDIAFPALELFSMLSGFLRGIPQLVATMISASVSMGRIEEFMLEPEIEELDGAGMPSLMQPSFENASFSWPGMLEPVLENVSLEFHAGLTLVCGKVGSGKTALLQAMLGELDLRSGNMTRHDGIVGYCSQTPWLQSMSIRKNITFSESFDAARYQAVLRACALDFDLQHFEHGDLSPIGENGIGLSGGQRARLALARAMYSRAKVLLLDDPISALDHETAQWVVEHCFKGPLSQGRTVILVTHRVGLCYTLADQLVEVNDKTARVIDKTSLSSVDLTADTPADANARDLDKISSDDAKNRDDKTGIVVPTSFHEEEHRAVGSVKTSVYWEYIKAGTFKIWVILIFTIVAYRSSRTFQSWFLKAWGEAYDRAETPVVDTVLKRLESRASSVFSIDESVSNKSFFVGDCITATGIRNPLRDLPSPNENIYPWLIGFSIIAAIDAFASSSVALTTIVIVYTAGRRIFINMMDRISLATFRFYDVTPTGRLMNRITSDIGVVDSAISQHFLNVCWYLIAWVISVLIIATVTPIFLIFALLLTATFVLIFMRYLPTSQSLRRLETVSLSPLMSNFDELLHGLTTVRAFAAQPRFLDRVLKSTDNFQKMDHFYWNLQAWLLFRFTSLSALSTFTMTLIALYTNVTPGLTAFLLAAAARFIGATNNLCKTYGQLQMDFVSVERVVELVHLEKEAPGDVIPPAIWPRREGDITFEKFTVRYSESNVPALNQLSVRLPGGKSTVILGRTGSGKSTMALALLGTVPVTEGRLILDGIDISEVNKQILRERVTFLAQDPLLFPGTIRENLDPLNQHSDEECAEVLARVCATPNVSGTSTPNRLSQSRNLEDPLAQVRRLKPGHPSSGLQLSTILDTGGANLSQGQRQLVNLARAVLRRSSIVILDEATASIDRTTAYATQRVLREELHGATVVTIAHRIEAVAGAEGYVRLEGGKLQGTSGLTDTFDGE